MVKVLTGGGGAAGRLDAKESILPGQPELERDPFEQRQVRAQAERRGRGLAPKGDFGAARPGLEARRSWAPNKAARPSIESQTSRPAGPPERARPRPRERSGASPAPSVALDGRARGNDFNAQQVGPQVGEILVRGQEAGLRRLGAGRNPNVVLAHITRASRVLLGV